jgi:hypothetical protein
MCETDLPISLPTPLDVDYHRHAEATFLRLSIAWLLPDRVARSTTSPTPKGGCRRLQALSITGFTMGGSSPVPEYQPDVHRLRLSASP